MSTNTDRETAEDALDSAVGAALAAQLACLAWDEKIVDPDRYASAIRKFTSALVVALAAERAADEIAKDPREAE